MLNFRVPLELSFDSPFLYCLGFVLLYFLAIWIKNSKILSIMAIIIFNGVSILDYIVIQNSLVVEKVSLCLIFTIYILELIGGKKENLRFAIFPSYALFSLSLIISGTSKLLVALLAIEACFLIIVLVENLDYLKRSFWGVAISAICYGGVVKSHENSNFPLGELLDKNIFTYSFLFLIATLVFRICHFFITCNKRSHYFLAASYPVILISVFPTVISFFYKFGILGDFQKFYIVKHIILVQIILCYIGAIYLSVKEKSFFKIGNIIFYLSLVFMWLNIDGGQIALTAYAGSLVMVLVFMGIEQDAKINREVNYEVKHIEINHIKSFLHRDFSSSVLLIMAFSFYLVLLLGITRSAKSILGVDNLVGGLWAMCLAIFGIGVIHVLREFGTCDGKIGIISVNWSKFTLKLSLILGFAIMIWGTGLMNNYVH